MTKHDTLRKAWRLGAAQAQLQAIDEGRIGAVVVDDGVAEDRADGLARIAELPVAADLAHALLALQPAADELAAALAREIAPAPQRKGLATMPTWLRRSGLALAAGLAAFALFAPSGQDTPIAPVPPDSGRIVSASFEGDEGRNEHEQVFRGGFDS